MRAMLMMLAALTVARGAAAQEPPAVRRILERSLPPFDRDSVTIRVLEVVYPPGGASAAHRHPCPVIGYVAAGRLRIQIDGQPSAVYAAGQSFHEPRGALHRISANASDAEPATLIAFFMCDNDLPLSTRTEP